MFFFDIVVNGFGGKNSTVGTQHIVYQLFEQIFFADFITVYQIIDDNGIIQIIKISALCCGIVKLKTFGKAAPNQIIRDRNFFPEFCGIFYDFFINKRTNTKSNISSAEFFCKFS